MKFRFLLALWASKFYRFGIRLLGKDGSCTPGMVAVKICPDFLSMIELPKTTICVTGTNGKTTTSNLLTTVLRDCGYTVTNNSIGSNVQGGVATALLADSKLNGKPKSQIAVLEVDERSSLKVYKFFAPDYLICNNIMRDSLKRNAHTDFIAYILNSALPESTHVILNADDFICARLFPNNKKRTYFGMSAEKPENTTFDSRDVVYCPDCGEKLKAEYVRFDHIGRLYCPKCGLKSPEPDYVLDEIGYQYFGVTHNGVKNTYKTVNANIVNYYNCCGAIAALCEMGISTEQIRKSFENLKIVKTRFDFVQSGDLKITMQLAKGQNPVACARAYSYVANSVGEHKCLLVMTDDKNDNNHNSESVCWIYDTDFSSLKNDTIDSIIFAGKRCRDQKARALLAGVNPLKIQISDTLMGGAALVDTKKYTNVYVLNDPYISAEAAEIRDYLVKKGANQ